MVLRQRQHIGQAVKEAALFPGLKIQIPVGFYIINIEIHVGGSPSPGVDDLRAARVGGALLAQRQGPDRQHVLKKANVPKAHIAAVLPERMDGRQGEGRVIDVVELFHADRLGKLIGERVLKARLKVPAQKIG